MENLESRPRWIATALLIASLAPIACGGDTPTGPEPEKPPVAVATTIALSQASLVLDDGATATLQATVLDQTGKPLSAQPAVAWSSADNSIATVSAAGAVMANAPGSVLITAAAAGKQATATITVRRVATSLLVSAGDNQSAPAGSLLPERIAVRVVDRRGGGMSGISVAFAVTAGGGSVSPSSAVTDADGYARTQWRVGTQVQLNTVTAAIVDSPIPGVTVNAGAVAVQDVTPAGGTLQTSGGAVRLEIPAQALGTAVSISVEPIAATSPELPTETTSGTTVPGAVFEFGPDGLQFAEPVRLALAYDPAQLPAGASESSLALFKAYPDGWHEVAGSSVSTTDRKVSATITGFSTYAVRVAKPLPPSTTTGSVFVQANIAGTGAARAALEVLSSGATVPLTMNLTVSGTSATGSMPVPVGTHSFTVRLFDASGNETHSVTQQASIAAASTSLFLIPRAITVPVTLQASIAGTSVTNIVASISGANMTTITQPLAVAGGLASATIALPAGADRRITLTATDAAGIQTHVGSAAITVIAGRGIDLPITLAALDGSLPISARVGTFTIAIDPPTATLRVGETATFRGSGTDVNGAPLGAFTWATSNPAILTVDANGLVTARYAGTARVVVSHQGFAAAATITVVP